MFFAVLISQDAKANVVCLIDNAELDFGTSMTGTGTINFTCTNYRSEPQNFDVCIALGFASWPGTAQQPAFPLAWPNKLDFNVYRDAALSQVWTEGLPFVRPVSIAGGIGTPITASIQFYGRIAPGQSPPPGNLTAAFYNNIIGYPTGNSGSCQTWQAPYFSGQQFTISVDATISNDCTVRALANADLGTVAPSASPVLGSTAISVNCPMGTPYNIGLLPSNGNNVGSGTMSGTGGNPDQVPYQLHSGSHSGPIWGNTASVSEVGNGQSGVGNGSDQNYPVYVTVPNSDFTPDNYSDTVRVTVHY